PFILRGAERRQKQGEGGFTCSNDGGYYRNDSRANDEEGHSDSTEGHDEDDEIYEGEYQGIPRAESGKAGSMDGVTAAQAQQFRDLSAYEGERRKDQEELAQQYETILQECGHGKFQWTLYFVLGLALMADGVEIFVVGFVLPSAQIDMCLSEPNKGMLGKISTFHSLALVLIGLSTVMCIFRNLVKNIVFTARMFFTFNILFGFCHICPFKKKRGEHLSWLCMFWMIGGIYASAMAWAIIPHYGWSFQMGSAYQFHSWRVFVLVCAFPSVAAISALTTMPESPRFFLEVSLTAHTPLRPLYFTFITFSLHISCVCLCLCVFLQVWSNFQTIFSPEYRRTTYMMMAVWFSMSFSYYGLTVWFPDMIKYLQKQEYSSRTKVFVKEKVEHVTFNFTLENQVHRQGEYFNDKFMNLKMKSMVFEDSLFEECYFEDITSTNTFFKNCTFIATLFYNTDLFKYRLINCKLINSTFLHNKEGCLLSDISDENNAYMVYFVSFLGTLAVLPGNIVSALLMDKIGRLRMLAGSSVISCISCFFLSFGNSESAMIALLCLFGGISIASWNSLDVLTVELYPSDKSVLLGAILNLCAILNILFLFIYFVFYHFTNATLICGWMWSNLSNTVDN
uniref:Synaptic vesicle glycoprotein 2A n=1 Tax=Neolamprologus brichardi TaxID=32507 RepID=A0A3Q4MB71_NEOBR